MGGKQGKHFFFEKVENDGYRPSNFIRLSDEVGWLCGGSIPIFTESLEYLKSEDIGLIILTLIEPLRSGVNYNHVPYQFDDMSWAASDDITNELKEFEVVHIPIADNQTFFGENSSLFLKTLTEYHISHPNKSVYIVSWAGTSRTHFTMMYALMKLYKMTFNQAMNKLCEGTKNLELSQTQIFFLKGEQLSDLDIYNSRPEIRTPWDHKCYQKDENAEDKDAKEEKTYIIAKPKVRYEHINCPVCRHQCDDVVGENFVEPIFKTLPNQIKEIPIVFSNSLSDKERELEKVVPYFSQELSELFKIHKSHDVPQNFLPSEDTIYNFATTFRSHHVPDMITLVKRLGDYIVYFDRKGRGLMMDIGNETGEVLVLSGISNHNSEGSPKNVFLYKDTSGDPILFGYRHGDYGIWKYKGTQKYDWIECYYDYKFPRKFTSKFKFSLTTTGKMVLITKEGIYYASFTFKQKPYTKYKLIVEEVPENDLPLYELKEKLIRPNSNKRHKILKKLSLDSVTKENIEKVASRGHTYDHATGHYIKVKEYSLHSIYAAHQYDDIIIAGFDWGRISVWKAQ